METSIIVSVLLVLSTSALLIVTGLKKQPGIGVIGAVVIIILATWLRGRSLAWIGLSAPVNWLVTILVALVAGVLIQVISVIFVEPLSEKITQTAHDFSVLKNVKGNWKALLQWLLMVWVFAALLEECVYRGFLMTEITWLVGIGTFATVFNVIFTSLVFGFSHGYQGKSGILSTTLVGSLLAILFIWSGYNLWLPIFTHGFIDTVGIILIAFDGDKKIRNFLWKDQKSS
jgi:hypothetical protein